MRSHPSAPAGSAMYRRLPEESAGDTVRLVVDGRAVVAQRGDTVAAVLLLAGVAALRRTPKSASPRGVYCGMGVCFDCLVTIDGEGSRQACLVPVAEGMTVETGAARRVLAEGAGG